MILFKETCGVIMTSDKKCILRGKSRYGMTLCLTTENSRLKVRKWKNSKNIENFIEPEFIKVSDKVKELYKLDTNTYNSEKMGELIAVKLNVTYSD